jgi:hypothetical protein
VLAREGSIGLVEDILRRERDAGVGDAVGELQVDGRRGDDDFGGGVEFGAIEVLDYSGDGLGGTVPAKRMLDMYVIGVCGAWEGEVIDMKEG